MIHINIFTTVPIIPHIIANINPNGLKNGIRPITNVPITNAAGNNTINLNEGIIDDKSDKDANKMIENVDEQKNKKV